MAAYMFTAAAGLLSLLPLLGLLFPASPYVPLAAIALGSMLYGALRARRVELAAYLLAATCLLAYCIATNGNSLIIALLRFVVPFAAIRLLLHWARKRRGNA